MTDSHPIDCVEGPVAASLEVPLLRISGLRTYFRTRETLVKAVDGVDIDVFPGECLGVVGESGSGKSVTFMSVMGLVQSPGWIEGGTIEFDGRELTQLNDRAMRQLRGKEFAMTLQDSMTALNPAFTVANQIVEVFYAHDEDLGQGRGRTKEARERAIEILRLVGIPAAETRLDDYPHQFSGGMRQRVMIAIALACRPKLLIADEPTTGLDVTIQAQVLELIADIRARLGMSVVLITHDLGVVAEYCDRVTVMYAGQVVETGVTADVIAHPKHPYTQGLLRSIPSLDRLDETIRPIEGQVPEVVDLPDECRFYERCPVHQDQCRVPISLRRLGADRSARCILAKA
jgi:oligopeptide/dipeptide ABC transporter ATP-binding protein